MRLLIIEDDKAIADSLRNSLKPHYTVELAVNGQDGLDASKANTPDLVILDLGLPDMSGFEVCRNLRNTGLSIPILVLTANSNITDTVSALDMGVDDYMVKPFSMLELKARLRALLRRQVEGIGDITLSVGDLQLNPVSHTVQRQQQIIPLRRKEFDLLEYLMHNPGRVLTRTMILNHVWDMNTEVWANTVDVHIKHLRDKVDKPFGQKLIRTIYGVGYKIESQLVPEITN